MAKQEKGKDAGAGKPGLLRRPSLLRALLRLFGPYYAFLGLFTFLEECIFRIFQCLFMGGLPTKSRQTSGLTVNT